MSLLRDEPVVRHAVVDHMKLSHLSYLALVGGFSPWVWDQIVAAMGPGTTTMTMTNLLHINKRLRIW